MTRYIVSNPAQRVWVEVEAQSVDHARHIAWVHDSNVFEDGKDGVWLDVSPGSATVSTADIRFREAMGRLRLINPDEREELSDLFQEALDEAYNDGHSKGHEEHSAADFWEHS